MYNYIKRMDDYKLYISENNSCYLTDIPIQRFYNHLLTNDLTNLIARESVCRKELNFKAKIPIYVNKEHLFMCIKSYRLKDCFYINYYAIQSYSYINNQVIINFFSKHSMKIDELYAFKSQIEKCIKVISFLEK